jgi:hypothetical protein
LLYDILASAGSSALQKLIADEQAKQFRACHGTGRFVMCSKQPATGRCSVPDEAYILFI